MQGQPKKISLQSKEEYCSCDPSIQEGSNEGGKKESHSSHSVEIELEGFADEVDLSNWVNRDVKMDRTVIDAQCGGGVEVKIKLNFALLSLGGYKTSAWRLEQAL